MAQKLATSVARSTAASAATGAKPGRPGRKEMIEMSTGTDLGSIQAERDAALAAVGRVRAVHVRDTPSIGGDWCLDDHHKWPCPTVAALDGAPETKGACGATWDCPPSEYHDTVGLFTCALPTGHGGPHVDAREGMRWNHGGLKHPDLGVFTAPGGLPVGGGGKP